MLHSTRSNNLYSVSDAILKGLADDGGLFVFDNFKTLDLNTLLNKDYKELALEIFKAFFDDFSEAELKEVVDKAYSKENFNNDVVSLKCFEKYAFVELFNGPTSAFKDMALTVLPHLLEASIKHKQIKEKMHIIVATSGDTGSATLSGFSKCENIDVTVLYPNNLVSPLQEAQMLYHSINGNYALAFEGNFDDCQSLAKEILSNKKENNFSSANSINIGRLVPQVVYYVYSYLKLVRKNIIKMGEKINVSVPTGNFGNILASYLAYLMGLPIDKFICASNENNVLFDLINTGIYDRNRKFVKTYSPSMDILVSSNVERFFYYHYKDTSKVKEIYNEFNKTGKVEVDKEMFKSFSAFYSTNEEILEEIKNEYNNHKYMIDPHTAVALNAYNKSNKDNYTLVISTASPYKFEDAIKDAKLSLDYNYAPLAIKNALKNTNKKKIVNKELVKEYIDNLCQR